MPVTERINGAVAAEMQQPRLGVSVGLEDSGLGTDTAYLAALAQRLHGIGLCSESEPSSVIASG